jgi:hypothetical protein
VCVTIIISITIIIIIIIITMISNQIIMICMSSTFKQSLSSLMTAFSRHSGVQRSTINIIIVIIIIIVAAWWHRWGSAAAGAAPDGKARPMCAHTRCGMCMHGSVHSG